MLNLHPLSYRREITDLLYVFKCIKGYYDVAWHNDIEVTSNSSLRSGNAGRVLRIKIVRTECFKAVSLIELFQCGTPPAAIEGRRFYIFF